jgi:hypothetical protein
LDLETLGEPGRLCGREHVPEVAELRASDLGRWPPLGDVEVASKNYCGHSRRRDDCAHRHK